MAFREILFQVTHIGVQFTLYLSGAVARLLESFLQGQGGHTAHAAGRDSQAMIGVGTSQAQDALDRIQPVHHFGRVLLVVILHPAARGKTTDVLEGRLLSAEKIAVQRENRLGLVKLVGRLDRRAERDRSRLRVDTEVHRLVLVKVDPLGLQVGHQARTRRRAALLHQHVRFAVGQAVELLQHLGLGDDLELALLGQLEIQTPIRVVQAQHGCLRVLVGSAVAVGVLGVALHLDRATVVRLDHQRHGRLAGRHRRGVKLRRTVHIVLRHLGERQNLVLRPAATRHPEAGQGKRSRHDLHEVPARNRILDQIHPGRELLLNKRAELRRISLVFKAPPVARAARIPV